MLSHMLRAVNKGPAGPVQYISSTTYEAATAAFTHNIPAPTVYNVGDLILILVTSGSSLSESLVDSGWTTIYNTYNTFGQAYIIAAYRTAGTEPSTYGVTISPSTRGLVATCVVLRNAIYYANNFSTSTSSSGLPVSITPYDATNDAIIYYSSLAISANQAATPPIGYTEISDLYTNVANSQINQEVAYRAPNSGQSTTSVTNTWSFAAPNVSVLFDFRNG